MTLIKNKSLILTWSEFNIRVGTSEVCGVYILRDSTTIEGIIYIGSSVNLRERLFTHWRESDIQTVKFFDWYQTNTENEARELEKNWIIKYNPRFNIQYL